MEIETKITVTFSIEEYQKLSDLVGYIATGSEPDILLHHNNSAKPQTLVEIAKDLEKEWEFLSS